MKQKDLSLKNEYRNGNEEVFQVYEYETPNLYFSFEVGKKDKIVYSYVYRNSSGEGMEGDLSIPVKALGPIIKGLDF